MLKIVLSFLILTTAGLADDMRIWRLSPLTFNTAFNASGKEMAISMPCGSAGLRDCSTVFSLLDSLTDSPSCHERFFIAIVDQSQFVSDGVADTELWLQFTYRTAKFVKVTEDYALDLRPSKFDCRPVSS